MNPDDILDTAADNTAPLAGAQQPVQGNVPASAAMPDTGVTAAPAVAPPTIAPVALPVATSPSVGPSQAVNNIPAEAEDADLIEKAWVEKAKDIVESTTGDPYTRSLHLNQMKSDYMKKRYNKEIKVDE